MDIMKMKKIKLRTICVSGSYESYSKGEDVKITDEEGNMVYAEGLEMSMACKGEFNKAVLREVVNVRFCAEIKKL